MPIRQKGYEVNFLDLKQTYIIPMNHVDDAIEEAVKTLCDCGIIAEYPRTPEAWAALGRIQTTPVRFEREI
jgi:hypothetical protein